MKTNLPPGQSNGDEEALSLIDIFNFFQESWKTIASFTVFGIAGAALYISVVPKQYEASAQIKMAQIANLNNNINSRGINIEEPRALIARMALPNSYPREIVVYCGLADQKYPEIALVSKVNLSIPKGVDGIVDLKVRDVSKDTAKACANAIYQLIRTSQAQLVAPYIDEARKKLKIEEERLSRATQLIFRAERTGEAMSSIIYFASRDEIRYLQDQILNLQNIINGKDSLATHLVAPIYLNDQPVFPQKRNSLLNGLLLGGFLGIVLALTRKWYRINRSIFNRGF